MKARLMLRIREARHGRRFLNCIAANRAYFGEGATTLAIIIRS